MKKKFKILGLAALILAPVIAYAASQTRLGYDKVEIGNSTAVDKDLRLNVGLGSSNPGIRGNASTGKTQFWDGSQFKDIGSGSGGGGGGVVLNTNSGFEEGTTAWTASGGTFAITSTAANVGFETQAGSWDASAASQTLSNTAVTVPAGLFGKVCTLSWYYKGGDANLKAQVYDGTNVIAESSAFTAQTNYSAKQVLYFTCPSSGTIQARFAASADAAIVYVDNVRIGQEALFDVDDGSVGWSGYFDNTCLWSRSNVAYGDPTADASCNFVERANSGFGTVSAVAGLLPGISFTAPKSGTIEICGVASMQVAATNYLYARWYDGTVSLNDTSNYQSSTQSNPIPLCGQKAVTKGDSVTLKWQWGTSGGTLAELRQPGAGPESVLAITMGYVEVGGTNQKAISVDKSGWRIDATIGGSNPSLGTASVASYTEITDSGLDMVLASGSASAEIPCSSTNPSTGLTCSAGNESVGVAFIPPSAGTYEVCADFGHVWSGNTHSGQATFQWVRTPNNAQTILEEGNGKAQHYEDKNNGVNDLFGNGLRSCGVFTLTDVSKATFRLMYEQFTSGGTNASTIYADRSASAGQRDITVRVRRRVEFADAVKFTNLVTTNYTNGIKLEAAKITNNGSTCTAASQTGTWITGIVRNSTGVCTLTMTGFSAEPMCTTATDNANSAVTTRIDASSLTSTSLQTVTVNNASAVSDTGYWIHCVGF